jgi:hypothetical protein
MVECEDWEFNENLPGTAKKLIRENWNGKLFINQIVNVKKMFGM